MSDRVSSERLDELICLFGSHDIEMGRVCNDLRDTRTERDFLLRSLACENGEESEAPEGWRFGEDGRWTDSRLPTWRTPVVYRENKGWVLLEKECKTWFATALEAMLNANMESTS